MSLKNFEILKINIETMLRNELLLIFLQKYLLSNQLIEIFYNY